MPRNHYFYVTGTVKEDTEKLDVELSVTDWGDEAGDGLVGQRTLNVSMLEVSINERNTARIWFSSDQADVTLESATLAGADVDDYFYDLTGNGASNFHYDPATGEGYFDLVTDRDKTGVSAGYQGTHHLVLNADGFRRTLKVNVSVPNSDFGAYPYVGAFWRNDQVGERVIAMANTGDWTAEVVGGSSWIFLEASKSRDLTLWTAAGPGDPELYPVENGSQQVAGTGKIYLRIGLTGSNPNTAPRYGLVKVTGSAGTQNIYIRQGEEADYLMRPEDPATTWSGSRSRTVKFSPYALTAQEYLDGTRTGGTSLSGHVQINADRSNAAFVEYPSQGGAYFQWATESNVRYAFHPASPVTDYITGYINDVAATTWNNLYQTYETCPPGYRRPNDGSILAAVNPAVPDGSESRQSIWLNPTSGNSSNMDNTLWGYYADGYFDRYPIEASPNGTANTAVNTGTPGVAYCGRLFYNENNNASLFFPASGYRMWNATSAQVGGNLTASGTNTSFWSSSMYSKAQMAWGLFSFTSVYMGYLTSHTAMPMRCVVGDLPDDGFVWTIENRVLAHSDALLYGDNGTAEMSWSQAMGIQTDYNSKIFYNTAYSSGLPSNLGYSYTSGAGASPATGCAAYWERDVNDAVAGVGKWFLPTFDEMEPIHLNLPGYFTGEAYWVSDEFNSINSDRIKKRSDGIPGVASGYFDAKASGLLVRCVRYPSVQELADKPAL